MNKQSAPTEEPWEPCELGVISESSSAFSSAPLGRRTFVIRCLGMAGATALVVGVTRISISDNAETKTSIAPTGLACSQVHANLAAFVNNKISDQTLRKQISCHLFRCCSCRQSYKEVRKENGFTCNNGFDPKPRRGSETAAPCNRANSCSDSDKSKCGEKTVAKDSGCASSRTDNSILP